MKSVTDVVKKMDVQLSREVCEKHGEKEIKKVILKDKVVCPLCYKEKQDDILRQEQRILYLDNIIKSKYHVLEKKSLFSDISLIDARISNFYAYCDETGRNHRDAIEKLKRMLNGESLNLWLTGHTGVGKSHLAMALLHALNENSKESMDQVKNSDLSVDEKLAYGKTCLFVNTNILMDVIRDSFQNKENTLSQQSIIDLLTDVDYLVLDDIGSEVGAIVTDKKASDFVTRVMYAVANGRQEKTTIYTTNLSSRVLRKMYDEKTFSRMTRQAEAITFKQAKDQRGGMLEF